MAIKTRAELETQSDNTFQDNNTGLIIPSNHRQWNDDLLETMFTGIAGRSVTKTEFEALVSNSKLVEGCRYQITDIYDNLYLDSVLFVTAKTSNTLDPFGYLFSQNATIQFYVQITTTSPIAYIFMTQMVDFSNSISSSALVQNLPRFGFNPAICIPQNPQRYKTIDTLKKSLGANGDTAINHNVFASRYYANPNQPYDVPYVCGFFPIDVQTNMVNYDYFYEDNGTQSSWGNANAINGALGTLTIDSIVKVAYPQVLQANFQKVNHTIFGQIAFDATLIFDSTAANPEFEFDLPFLGTLNSNWHLTLIGNGTFYEEGTNHIIMISLYIPNPGYAKARAVFILIGNHSGNINGGGVINFSYSLDPS